MIYFLPVSKNIIQPKIIKLTDPAIAPGHNAHFQSNSPIAEPNVVPTKLRLMKIVFNLFRASGINA